MDFGVIGLGRREEDPFDQIYLENHAASAEDHSPRSVHTGAHGHPRRSPQLGQHQQQ